MLGAPLRTSAALAIAMWMAGAHAATLCGTAPRTPIPAAGAQPVVATWVSTQASGSPAPDCTGLRARDFVLVTSVTARLADAASADALLERMGAVSTMKGMTYWSEKDQRREVLITDAAAVTAAGSTTRRADFTVAELKAGQAVYFAQHDNRASNEVGYSMRVVQATLTGWTIAIENTTPVKLYLVTLFEPGDIQTVISVEQVAPNQWGYRSLTGIRKVGMGSVESYRSSYANRAVAMFDHIAKH